MFFSSLDPQRYGPLVWQLQSVRGHHGMQVGAHLQGSGALGQISLPKVYSMV